jgi:hypothetical protein
MYKFDRFGWILNYLITLVLIQTFRALCDLMMVIGEKGCGSCKMYCTLDHLPEKTDENICNIGPEYKAGMSFTQSQQPELHV